MCFLAELTSLSPAIALTGLHDRFGLSYGAIMQVCTQLMMLAAMAVTANGADKDEIVNLCREGHLQARAAIRSLTCKVERRLSASSGIHPTTGKTMQSPPHVSRLEWVE